MPHSVQTNILPSFADLIAALDWSVTPLGPREGWPQQLTTLVQVMLGSAQPMFIAWGPEQAMLYNQSYAEILADKHPHALGRPVLDVWREVRADLIPIVEQAYAGQPVQMDDIELLMIRNGYPEETHFAFSYTPVRDEHGVVAGFFCACVETTQAVLAERERVAERTRLEQMFEQAPGFIAVLESADHRFALANRAYRELVGKDDLLGKPVRQALPELEGQDFLPLLDQVFNDGEAYRGDAVPVRLVREAGREAEERFVDFIYQPMADGAGKVSGIFVEGVDVTERKLAESALREREEQLRLIVDSATDYAILTIDPERRVTSWSPGAARTFGYQAEEILGRSGDELFTNEDRAAGQPGREMNTALRDGMAPDVRWHLRKDGSSVFLDGSLRPLHDAAGRHLGFLKIARDETERRRVDEALRGAEERYRLAARATNDAIWDWNLQTDEIAWNDAVQVLFGYRADEIGPTGAWWKSRIHPEDQQRVVSGIQAAIDDDVDSWTGEYRFVRADGSCADILDRGTVVRDRDGQALRMVGAMHDLSGQKAAERELRRLNETLEQRVMEELAARVKTEEALRQSQKMEAIGQLTGGVAHDFNNLLTVIRSAADILRRLELSEEKRRRYLDAIADTADRAAKLTGQLLAFARRQALKPEVFNVGERVDAISDMLRTVVGSRIELVSDTDCGTCYVEADATQFETALVNMTVNARDAMDGAGRLTIAVQPVKNVPGVRGHGAAQGEFVSVVVSDTGSGIPADKIDQIFEPFFTTKEVGKGTGLGLSQVYGFAKQSGGEVDVASEVGEGTTFTLYLPRVDEPDSREAVDDASADQTPGHGHILVVEDNEQVGAFSTQLLAELGFETSWAGNADAALRMLAEGPDRFAAVFSDVVMPGMSGVELGQEVRRRYPGLPVVLTSGYSHVLAQDARHGFELLHKPYSVDDLTRILRGAIRGRGAAA
jgi:PAS domain S-box-containing protein